MSVKISAKSEINQGSSFTANTVYASVLADSLGVLFIGDNGIPREVTWENLRNTLQWKLLTVHVEQLTQTYP